MKQVKDIICIQCPKGCNIKIQHENKEILKITGYTCSKGKEYAISEFKESKRVLTSTVRVKTENGSVPVAVKTDGKIPLDRMKKAIKEIRKKEYLPPINEGDLIYENILKTGVNVVATGRYVKG